MFSVSVFYQPAHAYHPLEAALYASLHRLGWCAATAWIIFACVTGNGGVMQRVLTWRPLVPLSRLTYCAYLVNGAVVLWGVAGVRETRTLSTASLVRRTLLPIRSISRVPPHNQTRPWASRLLLNFLESL
ncbi:hypothetical protein ONE63_006387 [Megalurothrips usitatus]|uniref:Nose resistant to fluoxetine protein 6-like n=1 Tax=Megalurothrips usitatus TaxID=439358 RepID=A0AAV7Y042_9NEOP|nr:hypothetical protein ONE63_006387 [Megalurothrips usitatus]